MGRSKPKVSNKNPKTCIATTDITNRNTKLVFSFEYLDLQNKKYSMELLNDNKIRIQFYKELHKKMNDYSKIENFKKYIKDNGKYRDRNHIHSIDWNDNRIRESSFTCLSRELMEQIAGDCWQLGINNNGFRMHGFFIENVFYIVWLDPLHNMYARK